jgi:hypothetical protein
LFCPTEPKKGGTKTPKKSDTIVIEPEKDIQSLYQIIHNRYIKSKEPCVLDVLNTEWNDNRVNSVLFNGTKYGNTKYFNKCLVKKLGKNWSDRVLNPDDTLADIKTVERLGQPGREGTTIKIRCNGKYYAVKVFHKGHYCGYGREQTLEEELHQDEFEPEGSGLLHEARLQQLASEHNVTVPVEAVYCGGKNNASFMIMAPLKALLMDVYKSTRKSTTPGKNLDLRPDTLSLKHQKQLWNLYKTLDEDVGIVHNDYNCRNIMIDYEDNIKLIDFGRSRTIDKKWLIKYGPYSNLYFLSWLGCFNFNGRGPGQKLLENYHKLFGCDLRTDVKDLKSFRKGLYRAIKYNGGTTMVGKGYEKVVEIIAYETLGISW